MVTRPALATAAVALAAAVSGCAGGGGEAPAAPAPPSPTLASPCPSGPATRPKWPSGVPADLPLPNRAKIQKVERTQGDLLIVRFTVPWSLRESVVHVVKEFPKAGYQLGRGEAEAVEADAPFTRGTLHGLARMVVSAPCQTFWLLALGHTDTAIPFNPSPAPGASASSLPLG